jgi:hypothetical protein
MLQRQSCMKMLLLCLCSSFECSRELSFSIRITRISNRSLQETLLSNNTHSLYSNGWPKSHLTPSRQWSVRQQ